MQNFNMEYIIDTSTGKLRVFQNMNYPGSPTVIFLHDSLGSIKQWKDFPMQLSNSVQCNVMVYDRQGHGGSDGFSNTHRPVNYMEQEAHILAELMELCEIGSAVLFGHSDGGTIALQFGAMYPEKTLGIISEAAHVFVEEITLQGIRKTVELFENNGLREKLIQYHGDKTDALFRAWSETWLSCEFKDWNILDQLKSIECDVLVIQGELDNFGSKAQIDTILESISCAAYELIIPVAGHTPHREAETMVLLKTAEFIHKLKGDGSPGKHSND